MSFRSDFKDLQKNHIMYVLGDSASYTPAGFPHCSNKTRTITGKYISDYQEVIGIGSSKPVYECQYDDVSDVTRGAKLTFNSIEYTIQDDQPAANEMVILVLEVS